MTTTIRIIANGGAKSMTAPAARQELTQLLSRELPGATLTFAEQGDDVQLLARNAIADGATMLVAGGGDGTVNAIASMVAGTPTVLGVLPLGTLNHFAKDLGIPDDMASAVRTLAAGEIVMVDVGSVNDRIFVNNSGLGLYPDMVHHRVRRQKEGAAKWTAALIESVKALLRYRLLGIRVVVDGRSLLRRTPVVFIGNNEYTVKKALEPSRERIDGGVLCLYIPHTRSRLRFIWFALRALFGKPRPDREFDTILTDALTIESRRHHLRVSLDGEVVSMNTPLEYRCRPRTLRVMAPTARG